MDTIDSNEEKTLNKILQYIQKNERGSEVKIKLSDAIEKYKEEIELRCSQGTAEYYNSYLRYIGEGLGKLYCSDIGSDEIRGYIANRKAMNPDVSKATLNKHIAAIKTVIKFAIGKKIEYQKMRERKKIISTVPKEVYNKIFMYYEKDLSNKHKYRNYLYFKILLDTGLRLSEATNITIDDLLLDESLIHVKKTKTDVDRYVVITKGTKDLLIKYIIIHNIKNYIFTDFENDQPLTTSAIESLVTRLKSKLNIKTRITPHSWRHTFATNFTRANGNMEALRMIMGHANLKTTQKYLHMTKEDIKVEYNKFINNSFSPSS
jgi:site-specific recombinase XerD